LAEELWQRIDGEYSIHLQPWPKWEEAVAADEVVTLVVQVNGKVREHLEVAAGTGEREARELALASPRVQRHLAGKELTKVIFVPDKLVNIVVR
jgi:leucyl-tRNA synthetase